MLNVKCRLDPAFLEFAMVEALKDHREWDDHRAQAYDLKQTPLAGRIEKLLRWTPMYIEEDLPLYADLSELDDGEYFEQAVLGEREPWGVLVRNAARVPTRQGTAKRMRLMSVDVVGDDEHPHALNHRLFRF